eukprot:m.1079112 g.1079112  ORF g.1079112 m.1079112 type:complete len:365 (+) comp24254_c0_seq43:240-1334(+)
MAVPAYVINRPTVSQVVHEHTSVDTQDNDDHSFNGIMFNIKCGTELPLKFIRIDSLWVRGGLGPMRIFMTKEPTSFRPVYESPESWNMVYSRHHEASETEFVEMRLDEQLVVQPGETYGVYVHSSSDDDMGIVYDNSSSHREDPYNGRLRICPGAFAHLNSEPFNGNDPWGWGHGWRSEREFVGRINYGVQYLLWGLDVHGKFPDAFRAVVRTVLLCANRVDSLLYYMPIEMIFFILNKLKWNAFGENPLPAVSASPDIEGDVFGYRHLQRLGRERMRHNFELGGFFDYYRNHLDAAASPEDHRLMFRDEEGNIVHVDPDDLLMADSSDMDDDDDDDDSDDTEVSVKGFSSSSGMIVIHVPKFL